MTDTTFEAISIRTLEGLDPKTMDALPFGVIGLGAATKVETYNATEARMAGLNPASVLGLPFFEAVAQCMNNFMVAQRFEDEPELDVVIPYVLTFRMRPTRVRLRLLATAEVARRYVLIDR